MSVLGHKTLADAERYTREADQVRPAGAAVTKLEGQPQPNIPQTGQNRIGKSSK